MDASLDDPFEPLSYEILPDEQLFVDDSADWWHNAVQRGLKASSVPLATSFQTAASMVLRQALDESRQDDLLFPILYLYRHALELVMKDLVYLDARLDGETEPIYRSHDLNAIWAKARSALERAGRSGTIPQLDAIGRLVGEIASIDLRGEMFRYDHGSDGKVHEIPPELMRVDVLHLHRTMSKLMGQLVAVTDIVSDMIDSLD